jgi:hypothetical protein
MIRAFGAHCHKRTHAPQHDCTDCEDDLVGAGEHGRRDVEAECATKGRFYGSLPPARLSLRI